LGLRCLDGDCDEPETEEETEEESAAGLDDNTEAHHLESLLLYEEGRPVRESAAWWFPFGGGAIYCHANQVLYIRTADSKTKMIRSVMVKNIIKDGIFVKLKGQKHDFCIG
jgi:hypothetical protein